MDEPLPYPCSNCNQIKPLNKSKFREKDDRHGKNGEPTSQCTQCTPQKAPTQQTKRIKDDTEGPEPVHIGGPVLPVDQTMSLMVNRTSGRVTTKRVTGDTKEIIASIVAGHTWEATDRFSE